MIDTPLVQALAKAVELGGPQAKANFRSMRGGDKMIQLTLPVGTSAETTYNIHRRWRALQASMDLPELDVVVPPERNKMGTANEGFFETK